MQARKGWERTAVHLHLLRPVKWTDLALSFVTHSSVLAAAFCYMNRVWRYVRFWHKHDQKTRDVTGTPNRNRNPILPGIFLEPELVRYNLVWIITVPVYLNFRLLFYEFPSVKTKFSWASIFSNKIFSQIINKNHTLQTWQNWFFSYPDLENGPDIPDPDIRYISKLNL